MDGIEEDVFNNKHGLWMLRTVLQSVASSSCDYWSHIVMHEKDSQIPA